MPCRGVAHVKAAGDLIGASHCAPLVHAKLCMKRVSLGNIGLSILCCQGSELRLGCVPVQPETVAAYLVPRVRTVVARQSASTYIKYLTIPRALGKFLSAPTKTNKYFNKQGQSTSLSC